MDAELVSIASDIAIGFSAVAVAIIARWGLTTWRKELTGKAKFEVARNVMQLGYRLQADFEWARLPIMSSEELAGRPRQKNESPDVSKELDAWYARECRLQPLRENLPKLVEAGWEAQIVLSEETSKLVSEAIAVFTSSFGDLASAIDSYYDETAHRQPVDWNNEWLKGLRKVFSSTSRAGFSKRIDEAIDQLASALKVYVK